ncbi:MAG: hypothetical protein ACI4T6_06180 [Candidatus Flemingiibacterium sp.]
MESNGLKTDMVKNDGDVVMISLRTKKLSDQLHVRQQKRIEDLERENAWLKIQLRKAPAASDDYIEVSNGTIVLKD